MLYYYLTASEAVVMYDYSARKDDELTLRVGDIICNIVKMDGGWWQGVLNGRKGVFPDNFVKVKRKPTVFIQICAESKPFDVTLCRVYG